MKKYLIVFLFITLIANCAKIFHKKSIPLEDLTLLQIQDRVESNFRNLSTLKGRARIITEMPGTGFNAIGLIAMQMPDLLKINIKAGFGMGIGSILLNGDHFTAFSAVENKAFYGEGKSFNMSKIFQVNMHFIDLLKFVSGIPFFSDLDDAQVSTEGDQYIITIKTEDSTKKYWVDPRHYVVSDFHLYNKDEKLMMKQEFRQYSGKRGVFLPKIIRIYQPQNKGQITLIYEERTTNVKLSSSDFKIKIPETAEKIHL